MADDEAKVIEQYKDLPACIKAGQAGCHASAHLIEAAMAKMSAATSEYLAAHAAHRACVLALDALIEEHYDLPRDKTYAVTDKGLIELDEEEEEGPEGLPPHLTYSLSLMDEEEARAVVSTAPPSIKDRLGQTLEHIIEERQRLKEAREDEDSQGSTERPDQG